MGRRQKGKKGKRSKAWHNGYISGEMQDKVLRKLPQIDAGEIDYTLASPKPFKRNHPPKKTEVV